jgi:hypothetical protein
MVAYVIFFGVWMREQTSGRAKKHTHLPIYTREHEHAFGFGVKI